MNSLATAHLLALTPAPGRGKRQLQTEADLVTATTAILHRYEMEGLLTWEESGLTYRDEWLIERGSHRLKGAPLSLDPLFVKRDDQVVGVTNLLSSEWTVHGYHSPVEQHLRTDQN